MTCTGSRCHGQRFDSKQNAIAHSLRTGPQPMISVSNAGNHRCLSLALSHRALGNNIDRRWRQSEDHEPSGGNRTKTTSFDGLRQIGRKTSRKLDDLPGSVKRLSGFLCREPYFPRFRCKNRALSAAIVRHGTPFFGPTVPRQEGTKRPPDWVWQPRRGSSAAGEAKGRIARWHDDSGIAGGC